MDNQQLQNEIFKNQKVRSAVTSDSHHWFFSTYFSTYLTHQTADFHRELFAISEDESIPLAVIVAFRGSAKSTIMTMSYPIWSIVGKQQKKFVVIASQTQYQAKVHLTNIKRELESNELLANDLGPFVEQRDEWGATSLYIPKYKARISAISTEQSIRGIRHGAHRPDLIICDDVEDMTSVKTREGRNKTFGWFTGEVIPAGDTHTKRIVIGNLLHEDSLLMRLIERLKNNEIDGIFREWPIAKDSVSLWPDKYPDRQSLSTLRRTIGNKIAWEREYMLRIIADEDQIIDPGWIKFYDELPPQDSKHEFIGTFIGVDLAISLKTSADCTAVVVVHAYGHETANRRYFVDAKFINSRITHMQTLDEIKSLYLHFKKLSEYTPYVIVEATMYQQSTVEQLDHAGMKVKGVHVKGDKYSRLKIASMLFESDQVFFPQKVTAPIIQQVLGFGVEKHDDLVDALTIALNYIHLKVTYGMLATFYPYDDEHTIYTIRHTD